MNNIEWKENAVCYAAGNQRVYTSEQLDEDLFAHGLYPHNFKDFQLNEIRTGDYIPASELDTEQKYNEVVEVFGLFGFEPCKRHSKYIGMVNSWKGVEIYNGEVCNKNATDGRQLTYHQIIAIGKLKRMMMQREKAEPELTTDNVKNPSHYQLIEGIESIEIIARSMTKEQFKGYCLGNMLKYRLRAGKKDALQQDIEKANFYGELYEMHNDKCYD